MDMKDYRIADGDARAAVEELFRRVEKLEAAIAPSKHINGYLERLAFVVADEMAASVIESECFRRDGGWLDTSTYDVTDPQKHVEYCYLRGLIETHPENPHLVRVKDCGE